MLVSCVAVILLAPGHGRLLVPLKVIEMSVRLAYWLPGARIVRRSPAAKTASLAKVKVAVLAVAAKVMLPIEAPFLRTSRSA
jgi:hypothetical protein